MSYEQTNDVQRETGELKLLLLRAMEDFGIGIDPTSSGAAGNSRVFRTDPGGILEDCLWSVAGKDHDKLMPEMARRAFIEEQGHRRYCPHSIWTNTQTNR
jgi:hypothetical protein